MRERVVVTAMKSTNKTAANPNHEPSHHRRAPQHTHLLFASAREFDAMLCDQLLDALLMKVDLCAALAVLRGHA